MELSRQDIQETLARFDEEEAYIEQALQLPQVKRDRSLVQRFIANRQAIMVRRVLLHGRLKNIGEQAD